MTILSVNASAWQPIISDDGNGQGCEAKYLTRAQVSPTSSCTSRRTASSINSPGSAKPARHDHMVCGKRGERPSTQRSPAIASMMTTGSVRGKCSALQEGQSRRQPPCASAVTAPQFGQKQWRVCQPSTDFASASGGTCSAATIACTAMVRRSMSLRSSRAFKGAAASATRPAPEARRFIHQPEKHGIARGTSAAASVGENSGSNASPRFLSTASSPAIT